MRQRQILLAALVGVAMGSGPAARACPPEFSFVEPPSGSTLPTVGARITVGMVEPVFIEGLERGVVWLRSEHDAVQLRAVAHGPDRVVVEPVGPLQAGERYHMVVQIGRDGDPARAQIFPALRGASTWRARPPVRPLPAGPGPLAGLFFFGLLPFGASYVVVRAVVRHRQRRILAGLGV